MKNLGEYMARIRKLVQFMGPDSLECYCRDGFLTATKVEEIEQLIEDEAGIC